MGCLNHESPGLKKRATLAWLSVYTMQPIIVLHNYCVKFKGYSFKAYIKLILTMLKQKLSGNINPYNLAGSC